MVFYGVFKKPRPYIKAVEPEAVEVISTPQPQIQQQLKPKNNKLIEAINKIDVNEVEGGNIKYKKNLGGQKKFDKFISLKL